MYSSFAVPAVLSILEKRGRLFHGASLLGFALAFLSEAILMAGHPTPCLLEKKAHEVLGVTALLTAAFCVRWTVDPANSYARGLGLFCGALHGAIFILTGVWLGKFFSVPTETKKDGTVVASRRTWGPFDDSKKLDLTTEADIMMLHTLVALLVVMLGVVFILRLSCACQQRDAKLADGKLGEPDHAEEDHGLGA
eukprot:CAMPEP_0115583126 /NCGR_PEP_ID=MMETSP0272-20121206/6012_1 /TAXON_ID=71861 /ORGANISM="Scrippsiella trochoidea, Strain CCMP3099" /LENGTH=194 /DNA_ID=CAMNT_0003018129 /DNA_START=261 /DNA_END=845 /DNA_ORIENTATION=-